MKLCEKCSQEHSKPGRFCSRSCANGRQQSSETNEKRRQTILARYKDPKLKPPKDASRTLKAREELARRKDHRRRTILDISWEDLTGPEMRTRVLLEQQYVCDSCSIPQLWNNRPLKFELDHIDGEPNNNARENLRFLCPNCHSQTDTYKVGNHKNPGKVVYSDDEIIKALYENTSGYKAMKALGMNPHGGNYTRIRNIIKRYNLNLTYTV